ncbi:MAG: hypothetical protein QM570_00050 [Planctomycetota bacterium]|nr:hypothetical protein [Planctomycetota bacterium]
MRRASLVLVVLVLAGCQERRTDKRSEAPCVVPVAALDANETHVVMEILDRPAFREAMPAAQAISLEQYRGLRDRYTTGHPAWRAGSSLTYRTPEGDHWRKYWLALPVRRPSRRP